jgi:hypothetical protein
MPRDYERELANIHDALAESVLTMTDDELLEEAFEEWSEAKGLWGDNPSAAIIPADEYSKFDFGLMCFKAGVRRVEELRRTFDNVLKKARAGAGSGDANDTEPQHLSSST